jgi:hypothetical protein
VPRKRKLSSDQRQQLSAETVAKVKAETFRGTGNPVHAADSFFASREAGVAPEEIILTWFEGFLREWADTQGREPWYHVKSFDRRPKRSRGTPAFKAAFIEERDSMLLWDLARLRYLQVPTDLAVEMVCVRLANTPDWNQTHWRLKPLKESVLLRKWKGWPERRATEHFLRPYLIEWGPDEIRGFLDRFPSEFRDRLPNLLKIHYRSRKR